MGRLSASLSVGTITLTVGPSGKVSNGTARSG
jgi:hypothetical protein